MLRKCVVLLASVFCGLQAGLADSIQLKDKAAITGKILAEKKDQVAVDVGYTVLVIPRNQVVKISKTDAIEASPKTPNAAPKAATGPERKAEVATRTGFYSAALKPSPIRNVRDLVNMIGEAVVQVRNPGGLGSGFII